MLEMRHIDVSFRSEKAAPFFKNVRQQVLYNVNFKVKEGTCLGILGESGSGKSTTGRVLCGLLKPDCGHVLLKGKNVYGSKAGKRYLQENMSIVFQDYTTSVNPRFRIKDIIGESLRVYEHRLGQSLDMKAEIGELLVKVGLDDSLTERYPHELSGGQLQRVCIARAIASRPKLIVLDEAISSLDAHTQVQIMDLLQSLKESLGLTYIFITHDLTAITYLCDEVLFLYQGKVTEHIKIEDIHRVRDEYASRLLASIIDY